MFNDSMESMRAPTNKVCFILMASYFKARRKFFARQFHQADIEFVAGQIGLNHNEILLKSYSKETSARQQRLILHHFGCSAFDKAAKALVANEISLMVRVQFRPKLVLLEIIDLLITKKIALPSYALLTGLIVSAINHYQKERSQIIDRCLTEKQRSKLDALLEKTIDKNTADEIWRYPLTLLKKGTIHEMGCYDVKKSTLRLLAH